MSKIAGDIRSIVKEFHEDKCRLTDRYGRFLRSHLCDDDIDDAVGQISLVKIQVNKIIGTIPTEQFIEATVAP